MARKPNQAPIVIPPSAEVPTGWHYYPETDDRVPGATVESITVSGFSGANSTGASGRPEPVIYYDCNCTEEHTMVDPVIEEERRDDEELDEFFSTTWKANMKEGFDVFRGDDRNVYRAVVKEYLSDKAQERRHAEEMHDMRMRHKEEMFASRLRDQHQSLAHRDLAIAQQWRDQARDSGESVFKPEQSS